MDWIPEDGHPGDPGDHLPEQRELFPRHLKGKHGQSRHVPARPRKAGDEPRPHRIAGTRHDDRDCPRRLLGHHDILRCRRDNHVDLETNQLGGEVWQPLKLSF
jgi:hypothetical protein